ncbi:MAG: hypothetical protein ACOYNI_11305 [Acidimicrobiia bacterium]
MDQASGLGITFEMVMGANPRARVGTKEFFLIAQLEQPSNQAALRKYAEGRELWKQQTVELLIVVAEYQKVIRDTPEREPQARRAVHFATLTLLPENLGVLTGFMDRQVMNRANDPITEAIAGMKSLPVEERISALEIAVGEGPLRQAHLETDSHARIRTRLERLNQDREPRLRHSR